MTSYRLSFALLIALLSSSASLALAEGAAISVPTVGTLPTPLMMHGSAVVGNRLYVIGGNKQRDGWTSDVNSGEISPNGIVTAWRPEAPLPELRGYLANGVESVNGNIYVITGSVAAAGNTLEAQLTRAKTMLWAHAAPEGVTKWNSVALPESDMGLAATCSTQHQLVITGGSSQGNYTNHVYMAELQPDGTPGPWRLQAVMPSPRSSHSAARLGDRIFVWGGLANEDRSKPDDTSWSAAVEADGNLSAWRPEANMPQPLFSSACASYGDVLITVGGRYANSYPTNAIWINRTTGGKTSDWTMLQSDLRTRVFHSVAVDPEHGWVFVTGGRDKKIPAAGDGSRLDVVQAFSAR
jgi:hypothetical protein